MIRLFLFVKGSIRTSVGTETGSNPLRGERRSDWRWYRSNLISIGNIYLPPPLMREGVGGGEEMHIILFPLPFIPSRKGRGDFLRFIFRDEAPDRSIVSSLPFGREETARELLHFPVIGNTFTAPSLPFTGFVGAGAPGFVLFDIAFQHLLISSLFRRNKEGSRIPACLPAGRGSRVPVKG